MESEIQAAASSEISAPALGFGGKFINIFTNPGRTFKELDSKPTWVVPVIIVLLLVAVTTQLSFPIIMNSQLESLRSNPNIPPERMEAIEAQLTTNANMQRGFTLIGQVIGVPLVTLILAGIFYLIGTVILGGDSTFKKVLAVVSWSGCVGIIGTLVTTALVMAKGTMQISLSPALLLAAESVGTKFYTFLSKFDFFTIWYLALIATGFAYIYKFSKSKAFTAVGVLWAIWIALSVALSGVLSQFGM